MLKQLTLAGVLWLVPLTVIAQQPPDAEREESGARHWTRGGWAQDADVAAATDFIRENAPNRWRALESLPEEGGMRRGVLLYALARYRNIQAVKQDDEQLYQIKLKQLRTEDELYGILTSLQTPEERQAEQSRITTATRALVDLELAERQRRLDRMREALKREEQSLASDREHVAEITERKSSALINQGTGALRREFIGRYRRDRLRGVEAPPPPPDSQTQEAAPR